MGRSLDIIIVNWNAAEQLRQCVMSIVDADQGSVDLQRTVIVDNASTDDSLEGVEEMGVPVTVVRNDRNRGFAAACNQGAKNSNADYLLFLNPDTRLDQNALVDPIHFMEYPQNSTVGIVGIQLVDAQGHVTPTCARFPTVGRFLTKMVGLDRALPSVFTPHFMTEWDHRDSRPVDQVMGAYFLIRRSLFDKLGGFDERFFVYFEEVDLSVRARSGGWTTYYLSRVKSYHRGGGVTDQVKATRLFYSLRSRILYGYKHFGRVWGTLLLVTTVAIEPFSRLILALSRRSSSELGETLRAYLMLWGTLPRLTAPDLPVRT